MDEHTKAIINVRLEKAKEDIATAHDLIALGRLRGAVNRAYYAIYHLATAVLLTQDIERSKHSGVQSAFGQYLIKPGLIEPEYGRILTSARKAREISDYADRLELDEEAARRIVADADRFVARMEEYLTNAGVL
ncbi:MAG TPA: HEPN domain-containing protein [Chloroflexi bacterium]|nr:HEPN domain-containing protein [Chloroflexota bacterium]